MKSIRFVGLAILLVILSILPSVVMSGCSGCERNKEDDTSKEWRIFNVPASSNKSGSDSLVPSNVAVQLKSIETDPATDRSWLVTEVSWDANSNINENELYAYLIDSSGNKYDIPNRSAFTIGNKEGFPDEFRYKTKDGRNYVTLKIPILKNGETKIESNSEGSVANGINVGDKFGVVLTSCYQSGDNWNESDKSKPVEVEFTEANVNQQKTFK